MKNPPVLPLLAVLGVFCGCVPVGVNSTPANRVYPEKGTAAFKRSGQQMVVEATLNRRVKANFLVDTGADLTLISVAAAKELGIDLRARLPNIRMQTLANSINVPLVVLDSVEVGGMEVNDLTVAVHDSPIFDGGLPGPPGILGRDFLSHFRVQIDLKQGLLLLDDK